MQQHKKINYGIENKRNPKLLQGMHTANKPIDF